MKIARCAQSIPDFPGGCLPPLDAGRRSYKPDPVQQKALDVSMAFFGKHLKHADRATAAPWD
jgi:hypothetical protein